MFLRALREQAGGDGQGGGAGAPPPAAGAPAAGTPPATGEPPKAPEGEPGTIPYARFKEVNDELAKLRRAEEARTNAELTAKGEHEKVAAAEKTKREEAERRAERVARRAAFMAGASGKVQDVEAAFKLALTDGLLAFDVDEEGSPKDAKAVEAAVAEVTKRYPFLKGQGTPDRDFGGNHGGTGPAAGQDPDKMTPLEKMIAGIAPGAGSRT